MYGGVHPLMSGPVADPFCYPPNFQPGFVAGAGPPGVGRPGVMAPTPSHGTPVSAAVLPVAPIGGSPISSGVTEVVHIWVPNHIVGALIGTKGAQIRNIIRLTGAHIRIESSKNENENVGGDGAGNASNQGSPQPQAGQGRRDMDGERRVTITGIDQQQYRVRI